MSDMAPMTQEQLDAEAHWKMPDIKVGMQIVWHPNWNDKAKVINGFVTRVSMRSIECMTQNGENQLLVRDVLHMSDPRLERNQYMQRNGSWEYSDITIQMQAMEKRLLALEAALKPKTILMGNGGDITFFPEAEVAIEEAEHVSVATRLPKPPKEKKGRVWTEEQKAELRERLKRGRDARSNRVREEAQEKAIRDTNHALEASNQ